MMIVSILESSRQLGDAVPFDFVCNAEEIGAIHEDFAFEGDITVTGTITNTGRVYRLEGTITCDKVFDCDRCLEHTVQHQVHEFSEDFMQGKDPASSNKGEEGSQSEDVSYFEGESIDVGELVRDTLLAAQPLNNICREDCKGLCLKCGANLNHGDCGCDRFIPDPRLAALQQLLS